MKNKDTKIKVKKHTTKYVFVVGGVISGVGKGVSASSIAKLMQFRGYKVTSIKIDPYINVDAGTMNPTEHGEVFVLGDGDECDQDMGNYERFLNSNLSRDNYMTTGRVYKTVIENERNLKYKGKCVQVVPHIPFEVINRIKNVSVKDNADIVIVEIGGTVGEYENILFLEAVRMLKLESPLDVAIVMVSYIPIPNKVGEMKTKPTQHAVRVLNSTGLYPDFIIARSEKNIDEKRREKISLFCNVKKENIISAPDVESIYDIPKNFEMNDLGNNLIKTLNLKNTKKLNLEEFKKWNDFFDRKRLKKEVNIAIVGKYFDTGDFVLSDSYISVIEALKYAGFANKVKVNLKWIDSKTFEKDRNKNFKENLNNLKNFDGVLVPGGFGDTGVEGIINAIQFVRENKIPYFGICYGMQLAIIEYSRNLIGFKDATSRELLKNEKSKHIMIDIMESQKENLIKNNFGNTMRLGNYEAILKDKSLLKKIYSNQDSIIERHRHRYEVNNEFRKVLEDNGIIFSATSKDNKLIEAMELNQKVHPFFIGVQYHPEFLARPLNSHPIFTEFVKVCKG